MEKVGEKAFENLKLVVELDFSWNKLKFVPLPQMRQLSLLRRLNMRGNPLFSLDEITLSGGINNASTKSISGKGSNSDEVAAGRGNGMKGVSVGGEKEDEAEAEFEQKEAEKASFEANNVTLQKNLTRFYETYPKLARTIVLLRLRSGSNSSSIENSVIIKSSGRSSTRSNISNGFGLNFLSDKVSHEFLEQNLFEEDSREFEILRALIERADEDSAARMTTSLLDKIASGGSDEGTDEEEEGEQLEVSPGNERQLDDNSNTGDGTYYSGNQKQQRKQTFGTYFKQLQELDFGQCKLSYIKWTSFSHLKQLKRLLLDGNHLR